MTDDESPVAAARAWIDAVDDRVDGWFERLRGRPVVDRTLYSASALGDFSLLWVLIGAARGVRSDDDARAAFRLTACLAVESALVNGLIKSVLPRSRPTPDDAPPHQLRTPVTGSFPSGHASAGFTAAGLLADQSRHGWTWYVLATVVASSRIHTRSHHLSDVAAGALLGVAFARIGRKVWPLPPPARD